MANQPTAWKHGATARFQNHPLKQAEFEQLCVELQTEYRAKTRSELELIKNLATEFMRAEHNAVAEQAKLEQVNLHSQLTSQPLDEVDGSLGVKMRYARNVEAGVYDFRADRAEEVFLRGLANTMLISREIASLTNRKQEGSLKAIIEETDRLGLQLRAILADSEVNPVLFTTYLEDRPPPAIGNPPLPVGGLRRLRVYGRRPARHPRREARETDGATDDGLHGRAAGVPDAPPPLPVQRTQATAGHASRRGGREVQALRDQQHQRDHQAH